MCSHDALDGGERRPRQLFHNPIQRAWRDADAMARARIGNNPERAAAVFDDIGILRRSAGAGGKAGVPAVFAVFYRKITAAINFLSAEIRDFSTPASTKEQRRPVTRRNALLKF